MKKTYHPLVWLGIILGASFLVATLIGAVTIFRIRGLSDTVAVTGSAKIEVTADQAKWNAQIMRTVRTSGLRGGYDQMASDLTLAKVFIAAQGITETEVAISPVSMNEVYQQDQTAEKIYSLTQTITIQSPEVAKITAASNRVSEIINKGVLFSTNSVEYYYSGLPEARVQLLSQAIEDAKVRAGEIAKNSGKRVGSLKSASSGVVQVQARNSTDISDYGSYDTSTVDKQITVTVKASFSLK